MEWIKIKCSSCQQEKWSTKNAEAKKVEKFGSVEAVKNNWRCRDCKKIIKNQEIKG